MSQPYSSIQEDLRLPGFTGTVHLPGEAGYDEARRSLNPAVDSRPALIAEAQSVADLRIALLAARAHGLPFAVQSTGHGTHAPCDGGILVKTSAMASVLVDPERRIAHVGPGARWADVIAAAAPFGLAPLSGSAPSVGVTGYTLGGGLGWLARKHGFAADSVLRAEVLLADGRHVTASPSSHPELFWALRGGGAGFGVVTSLEFRLHPVSEVFAGFVYFPIEVAERTLEAYRTWIDDAPDEISTAVVLKRMPGDEQTPAAVRGRHVVMLKVLHAGTAEEGRRLLAPLLAAAGPALLDETRTTTYAATSMGGTPNRHMDMFDTVPGEVVSALVRAAEQAQTIEIRHWGGAMGRPGPDAGPVSHRATKLSVIVDTVVPGLAEELRPYANGGTFLNFLADPARTAAAFTEADYRRLREVKRVYDPDGFFRVGHVVPA
ncbi:putative oxidoreductase [[Actinomadura] parvosata subsp. kistnae]|uniref:FAD-linked oxidoreductase n=1 Tax=[Actinomadura] parvosata subsp. kistnae TaxID=1909395 RepID=A0A1U9ZUN6_9ACTN|nr:FAD-dependent oxidoreductase [Nonomuraea sp. ATCC 55076]AQZ61666.1 FAD-linked oxidoreductase [Nonomuraea sp. ATCC 55076]SPL87769.1 putative oxidoreductase [Actinomadura parvosata subsp. kistnae]